MGPAGQRRSDREAQRWSERGAVWAERGKERRAGPPGWVRFEFGLAGEREEMGPQERGVGLGLGFALGWFLVLGFLSISPFLFLIQTNTQLGEFKFKFEFTTSTQTNKLMHQHECNTNN